MGVVYFKSLLEGCMQEKALECPKKGPRTWPK